MATRQRHEDRHRPHQVRGEAGREQAPLGERLVHQVQLELLEVAQAAVDQLARPARRARRQVTGLDQRDAQPSGGGIQRGARAGDTATDDEDVEALGPQPVQVGGAPLGESSLAAYRDTAGSRTCPP
ncbi:hypothetical protein Pflav_066440 [Phytohabitans flavus]|uniref:Uncharacterized protein n=1 Tax=Phytohabitans flavus TaxID=1076124 RepID=A0A6F8Y297_9ACTN|nr:hypothetical protein Pflav_066440 [Phytohabitans flavus]